MNEHKQNSKMKEIDTQIIIYKLVNQYFKHPSSKYSE